MGGGVARALPSQSNPCDSVQAQFFSSNVYAEPGEAVLFTNTSENFTHCQWYIDDSLVATSINLNYTFNAESHYDIRLDVFDSINNCSNSFELEQHVHTPVHFCGDLDLPDQDPSECPCMTTFDPDENGEFVENTYYRWLDRWGNKYCNLSVAGNCEDNRPLKNASIPNPPTPDCQAGYFHLYYTEIEVNGVSYPTQAQQAVICQVFKDIAELLTPADPDAIVNFQIFGVYDPNTGTLASAGSYYDAFELGLLSDAIVHGNVWKAINTTSSDPSIFHGLVNVNGAKNFFTGFDPDDISSTQFDLYGIMQHEILHALGVASLITSYAGSSFYQQNNLFSAFDEHLLTNNIPVLTHNGTGTYTFNNLGNNCNQVEFDNIANSFVSETPVNASLGGSFYSPCHFDDNCPANFSIFPTDPLAINELYVMNPSISPEEPRRIQLEEVNSLCKMGYVISGIYGSSDFQAGGTNPNIRTYDACTVTGSGVHLSANNDNYLTYGDFYPADCSNNYLGPSALNLMDDPNNPSGNDTYPPGTTIVDLTNLQTGLLVDAADLLPNGFNFIPTALGFNHFSYRLYHAASQTYSNIAIVSIFVTNCGLVNCAYPPSGCNLIGNYEFERDPCEYFPNINLDPSIIFPCWSSVYGTCDFYCGTDIIPAQSQLSPTNMNIGGAISGGVCSYSNAVYGETMGQSLVLNQGGKYLASFYFRRKPINYNQPNNNEFRLQLEYADQTQLPIDNNTPITFFQSVIYQTELITAAQNGVWMQAVNAYTNTLASGNMIVLGPSYSTEQNVGPGVSPLFTFYEIDHIELIEDNFTAGDDKNIGCNQSAVLSAPCMDITNLQYAWYELDDFGNIVGQPIALNSDAIVSPTITTSYRLIRYIANQNEPGNNGYFVENAGSLYEEDDVTIFVQTPSGNCEFLTSTDPENCAILFTSNNPYGTHFWDFGDGTTSTDVNPTHVYANNGFYNVTHTITEFGCECVFEQTVQVCCNASASFSLSNEICQNTISTLPTTSLEGITGTWSPQFSSTNLGTSIYVFTPNDGCYESVSISILIYNCDCENTPGIQLSGVIDENLAPGSYRIVGDVEIQGAVNFPSCVIAIDPNVSIQVPENQSLIITESHLYGCYTLWDGIDVEQNGILNLQESLIEDAKIAVNMQEINSPVSGWRLSVSESIFNKNHVGIKINGYPFDNSNTVFDISTVAFSSREISPNPNIWPSFSTFIAQNPNANNNNFEDPRINPSLYPPIDPLYILIQNGLDLSITNAIGLWLNEVGSTINPNLVPSFNSFELGSTVANLPWVFDRMSRGIYAVKSNLNVNRPTVFQAHQELAKISYGIYAESFVQTPGTQLLFNPFDGIIEVGAAQDEIQFYNVSCGVYVEDYTDVDVQNCRFRSKRENAGFLSHIGLNGIRFETPKARRFVAKYNDFHNIRDGVFGLIGHPINYFKINLQISENNFGRLLPSASGVISSTAIQVSSLSSTNNIFYADPFIIENNTISGTRRGIYLSNLHIPEIKVDRNDITLEEYIGTPWDAKARFFGIHCRTVNASKSRIYENNIQGFNTVNTQSRGIWMDHSSPINVLCNNTEYIGAGLYFYGNCQSSVLQNNMHMNRYGLWLDGQGYIGQQGTANGAAGNTWSGSGATAWTPYQLPQQPPTTSAYRIKTYVSQGSLADDSPMYVLPLASNNPEDSWAAESMQDGPYILQALTIVNTIGNSHLCEVGLPVGDDPNGTSMSDGVADFDRHLLSLEKDAEFSEENSTAPSKVIREQLTYDYLFSNPSVRDSSAILDSFYLLRVETNVGKLREMKHKLDEQLLDDAEALRDQVIPENLVEQSYREVLDLQLKYQRGLFSSDDSIVLHIWAESCFYLYGKAVPLAQALYNQIYNTTVFFSEDCPEYLPKSVSLNATSEQMLDVLLYPNPNSNILYGKANEEDVRAANCIIRTIDGKLIYSGSFHFKRGLNLSELGLVSGVYMVELSFDKRKEHMVKKIVFLK